MVILNNRKVIILYEFLLNMLSFTLLILTQQLIIMPIISRYITQNAFGELVTLISISNIVVSIGGFSIGQARLLENDINDIYDIVYKRYFIIGNVLTIFVFLLYFYFKGNYLTMLDYSIFILSLLLGEYRYLSVSEYRYTNNNSGILFQSFAYLIGAIIGIILFKRYFIWSIIFLIAEVSSFMCTRFNFSLAKFVHRSKKNKSGKILHSGINNGLEYSIINIDRFVSSYFFGMSILSVYYASSVTSKVGGLILNPLSNYMLGKFAAKEIKKEQIKLNIYLFLSLFVLCMYFALSVIITPFMVKILYPKYLQSIKPIYVYVCIANAILAGVAFTKNLFLKYMDIRLYNKIYFFYGIFLIVLCSGFSHLYGLQGFVISLCIANLVLYFCIILCLRKNFYTYNKEMN